MLLVGLTGGIASGKSLVSHVFKGLGAHIIDADRIVHELLSAGQQAWDKVVEYFGEQVLLPDGSIDRRKLGEVVFTDPEKRAWLNNCIHPLVFESYQAQVKRLRQGPRNTIVVFDAALLIETGYHKKMDKIVVVYAEQSHQLKRLMERDRFTYDQAMARIRSQMPLSEKRAYADYVVENTGDREKTEHRAKTIFTELKQEADKSE